LFYPTFLSITCISAVFFYSVNYINDPLMLVFI